MLQLFTQECVGILKLCFSTKRQNIVALIVIMCGPLCIACAKHPEITDPVEAAKDPDFAIQGEYLGEGRWNGEENVTVGAQVVAFGDGLFKVIVYKGGLPGNGWQRENPRLMLEGRRNAGNVTIAGENVTGRLSDQSMTIAGNDGKTRLLLKRTQRHSPTEGAKPPKDAVVLFDGTNTDCFEHGVMTDLGTLQSEATTKQGFGDYKLHLEFRLSYMPTARGQERSNSGVYLHDCYEIQVLDSFGLEGEDNECGGLYSVRRPEVNMCFPPLCWQTYDIEFTAPRYEAGKKVANARIEARHNGVLIQPEIELPAATPGRQEEGPSPRPLYLQGHGNKVQYRNIWLVPKN